jgi:uncharacterized protein YpuA (DUF1002 family)
MKTLYTRLTKEVKELVIEGLDLTPLVTGELLKELYKKQNVNELSLNACNTLYNLQRLKQDNLDFRNTIYKSFKTE